MSKEKPISIRLPKDVRDSVEQYATLNGMSAPDVCIQAIYEFMSQCENAKTNTKDRMSAEMKLLEILIDYAENIKNTQWEEDVTRVAFEWIKDNHLELYNRACGNQGEYLYRINPQIGRRFAMAIGADVKKGKNGKSVHGYLPRDGSHLIKSYTLLIHP